MPWIRVNKAETTNYSTIRIEVVSYYCWPESSPFLITTSEMALSKASAPTAPMELLSVRQCGCTGQLPGINVCNCADVIGVFLQTGCSLSVRRPWIKKSRIFSAWFSTKKQIWYACSLFTAFSVTVGDSGGLHRNRNWAAKHKLYKEAYSRLALWLSVSLSAR